MALAALSAGAPAQQAQLDAPLPQEPGIRLVAEVPVTGSIHGVVVNGDGAVYEGAKIVLTRPRENSPSPAAPGTFPSQTTTTDGSGRFSFAGVPPGPFTLTVSSSGFATQVLKGILHPGESFEAAPVTLSMSSTTSEVQVTASQVEIGQEVLKQEETQRVLGVIPNFYVSYVPNAPPLTSKQKFNLAWRSSIDPVTFLAVGVFAGIEQADDSFSGYGQGAQGYAKRYGAGFTDSFTSTMIGGAILPAWWKQDPRYFYKGTGTVRSRALYAITMAVLCKGDNGRRQVNYSGIVGGLASGAISNLYYPAGDRDGAGLTFENALIGTGLTAVGNLFQEFVIRRLTPKVPNYAAGIP